MARRIELEDLHRVVTPSDAQLRPGGDAVVFVRTSVDRPRDENVSALWWAGVGDGVRPLTRGGADTCPRWSPTGGRLAFLRSAGGPPQLYVMPADAGEPVRLTDLPLGAGEPVWSPDGARVAFSAPVGEVDPDAPVVVDA